ncbi:hypothetical protein SAY86_025580 [Trapa natans]|uniref:EF-hand domain-containing protein n=1 Tax=Trapa natans TaxID=22666 RepID=A0AAN7MR80_TRANT|nr:hypothetical protein SAY86_025580 [Trapa natans]
MKAVAVYTLLATAFIFFLVTSPATRNGLHGGGDGSVAVNIRRLGSKYHPSNFDPFVAEIERKNEGNLLDPLHDEDHSHRGNLGDPSTEYLDDQGKLNITLRLMVLFPFIDNHPQDGFVSLGELEAWNMKQATDRLFYRTEKEMDYYDKDGDGEISFREYLPQFSEQEIAQNKMEHGNAGWWKQQIANADVDRNGTLSFIEFMDFLHPEDSNSREIHRWLMGDKLTRMDSDGNGKLNLEEFVDHVYAFYQTYAEFENGRGAALGSQEKFDELDTNKDGELEVDELIPMLPYLYPGEFSHSKHYSSYLIHEADDNRDGKLILDEILNHEMLFYTSLLDVDEYDEDLHDEL